MRIERTKEVRKGERRPFQGTVQISWQNRSGETRTVRAKCLDVSGEGARVECECAMDFRTNVYVQAPAHGLMGNATVRYCRSSGIKHIIGLHFGSAISQAETGLKRMVNEPVSAEKLNAG